MSAKPSAFHRVWIGIRIHGHKAWRKGWARNTPAPEIWRQAIAEAMDHAVKINARIGYRQYRPVPPTLLKQAFDTPTKTIDLDCSSFDVNLCNIVGIADPTGNHYNGDGNTESIRANRPQIKLAEAKIGDDIVYGPDGHPELQHTAKVRVPGKNPVVCSHGQAAGPFYITHSQEDAAHVGSFTVHRNGPV